MQATLSTWNRNKTVQGYSDTTVVGKWLINILTYVPLVAGKGETRFHVAIVDAKTRKEFLYAKSQQPNSSIEQLKEKAVQVAMSSKAPKGKL